MSNAHHPEKIEAAGAPGDTAIIGSFMARRNTVRAETLARLLNGERLTGLGAVAESSTTRLADVAPNADQEVESLQSVIESGVLAPAVRELQSLGDVHIGMLSGWEFTEL